MASSSDKEVLGDMDGSKVMQVLTKNELERLTEVFKMYETGVREAAIRPTASYRAIRQMDLWFSAVKI